MHIYTVTFNPAIDYIVHLEGRLKTDGINRSRYEAYQFGGKGINVSGILNRLGCPTTALGFVAGFTGEALEKGLQEEGLNTDFIHLAEGMTRINVKVKAVEEGEINGMGPVIPAEAKEALYRQLEAIPEGDVLVLSGSIPGSLPSDTYEQILKRLAGRKILTVVDAAGELLVKVLKYHPFLIKPNDKELGEIFGIVPETEEEILTCARMLQAQGGRNILVSRAEKGALLLEEGGEIHRIGCPKGEVKNSVGAGDSMVAGFLAGYLETGSFAHALKLGTAAGSATAFSTGLAEKDEILKLLASL